MGIGVQAGGAAERPGTVTVLAIVFLVLGALGLLGSVLMLLFSAVMFSNLPAMPGGKPVPGSVRIIMSVMYLIPALVSGLVVVASVYFLKLKRWAHTVLEVICWVAFVLTLLGTLFYVVIFLLAFTKAGSDTPPINPLVFVAVFGVFGLACIAVEGALLYFLRKKEVKEVLL